LTATSPSDAQVDGRVLRVGLFAGANPIVRVGQWAFIEVDLRYTGTAPFDGELRVDQLDLDGDVVTSILKVALTHDSQWRPYQVYFVASESSLGQTLRVRMFDPSGRLVRMRDDTGQDVGELTAPSFFALPPDEMLILDLSSPRKLAHVSWLDKSRMGTAEQINSRNSRPLSPRELPVRWQGLEPADAIVWDDADPGALSVQQIEALINWVKAGGRLLITAGSNWQTLAGSPLAAALPAKITGAGQDTEAQEFLEIIKNEDYRNYLERYYSKRTMTRCTLRPLPDALPIPAECDIPQLVYRRLLGRGTVVFAGASLQHLLPPPRDLLREEDPAGPPDQAGQDAAKTAFLRFACEELVARDFLCLPPVRKDTQQALTQPLDLHEDVRRTVGFGSSSAIFLIFAILFAIAYTIWAAGGSFWYLRKRSWLQHCWTAFAATAVVGSVIGSVLVWTVRGFTTKLAQTTIVDAKAGEDYCYATCLFGVKTPNHQKLDLRLPAGPPDSDPSENRLVDCGSVRAMPESVGQLSGPMHFVAPEQYGCELAGMALDGVKVRATLKEFQGCWEGPLGGTVDGKLIAKKVAESPLPYEFVEGSFIRNNLKVPLRGCYLLETRSSGAITGALVNCWSLGDISPADQGGALDAEKLRQILFLDKDTLLVAEGPKRIKAAPRLDQTLREWEKGLGGLRFDPTALAQTSRRLSGEQEYLPLYMLSVFSLLEGPQPDRPPAYRRSHARLWECLDQLTERSAILIGHVDDAPPPVALELNRKVKQPNQARTLYRFVIPVERKGAGNKVEG
jgi:hypothetical protein